jgi:choline dehydrogenase-like flavoprotein
MLNKAGMAEGALYYDADGHLTEQKARVVVLACNGIGTARLLLNSKSRRFPHGLANDSGLVGKGLMGHPKATVVGVFEDDVKTRDIDGVQLASDEFCRSDPSRGFVRGFWIMSGAYGGAIDVALGEDPTPLATAIPVSLRGEGTTARALPWGAAHHAAFDERYRHSVGMSVYADELPEDENRVELDPTLVDDFGIPAPKLFYRRGENTDKMLAYGIERCKVLMQAAGALRITSAEKTAPAPGHYLGTARMGRSPERSVVDKWGRAHDVKNLFIIDGSVFVTSAAGLVPTSTIQAIALRTADYIKNNARQVLTS